MCLFTTFFGAKRLLEITLSVIPSVHVLFACQFYAFIFGCEYIASRSTCIVNYWCSFPMARSIRPSVGLS